MIVTVNKSRGYLSSYSKHLLSQAKRSMRENLLHTFEKAGKESSSNTRLKFWEHENHPVLQEASNV